jgi:hypothetical protein
MLSSLERKSSRKVDCPNKGNCGRYLRQHRGGQCYDSVNIFAPKRGDFLRFELQKNNPKLDFHENCRF